MNDISIREVLPDDNAALAAIIRQVFEEYDAPRTGTVYADPETDRLYETFREPGAMLWVATQDGRPSGLCGIYPTPGLPADCAELVKFYLPASARGLGTGKALMEQCFRSAHELGYRRLYLESLPAFATAVGMYERAGFVRLPAPMGASGHSSCNIWMIRELSTITP